MTFKLYDVTHRTTNSYNINTTHYFKKQKQSDNEIWLINRKKCKKYFSSKIIEKIGQGDYNHSKNIRDKL